MTLLKLIEVAREKAWAKDEDINRALTAMKDYDPAACDGPAVTGYQTALFILGFMLPENQKGALAQIAELPLTHSEAHEAVEPFKGKPIFHAIMREDTARADAIEALLDSNDPVSLLTQIAETKNPDLEDIIRWMKLELSLEQSKLTIEARFAGRVLTLTYSLNFEAAFLNPVVLRWGCELRAWPLQAMLRTPSDPQPLTHEQAQATATVH